MKTPAAACALALYILISQQGCATRASATKAGPLAAEDVPDANPELDRYIAWVPRSRAQTPTVAVALTHISMGYAREQAARKFCEDDWLMDESVTERVGPIAVTAPEAIGSYQAWYYRVSLQPGLLGCEQAGTNQLYRAIRDNLPGWIILEIAVTTPNRNVTQFR